MKTVLLEAKKDIKKKVTEDTQFVVIPSGETEVELTFEKEGINAGLLAIYSLKNMETGYLRTRTKHKAPNTTCDVKVKGVLNDSAKSDYVGEIIIDKKASGTNSFLEARALLLGEKSKSHAKPILEIENNDVKSSHGVAVGRINEDEIYYLMSRGLERKEAEKLIIDGFFESVISEIEDESVRSKVKERLNG